MASSDGWLQPLVDAAASAWLAGMGALHSVLMPNVVALAAGAAGTFFLFSMGRLMTRVRELRRRYDNQQEQTEGTADEDGRGSGGEVRPSETAQILSSIIKQKLWPRALVLLFVLPRAITRPS